MYHISIAIESLIKERNLRLIEALSILIESGLTYELNFEGFNDAEYQFLKTVVDIKTHEITKKSKPLFDRIDIINSVIKQARTNSSIDLGKVFAEKAELEAELETHRRSIDAYDRLYAKSVKKRANTSKQ